MRLSDFMPEINESEAWQKKSGKNKNGGLNKKGVASYRRSHPGSKLQTAVTTKPSKLKKGSKASKRRKSFCARMKGMKKHNTSAATKRDPNSRINKSLRKWNCESVEELQLMLENAQAWYNESVTDEAWLHNDPEQGHQIRPDGGMGTWNEQTLVSNLAGKLQSMVGMLKNKDYASLQYVLYEGGVVKSMVGALAQYQRFQEKQGRRPIAKGREVDMSQVSEVKQRLDAKCWKGKHKEGTKIKGGVRVNNCVPNEE